MGFLSRKKPKAAPVELDEQNPIAEDLQEMESLVPEREEPPGPVAEPPRPAGPVADTGLSSSQAAGENPESAPPAGEAVSDDEGPSVSAAAEEDEGDGRLRAVDLIAPTRLDFLKEKEAAEGEPVKTAEVIAFANQKGGVAKTTTTLNLAVAFAESGHRVLCVDLDPQGNLTMSQGVDPDKVEKSLYDVLVNDMPISEIIVKREIDIAVASIDLAGAEIAMSTKIGRERSLEKALKEVSGEYDFVCIDTPPSLGLLTINALTAANKVIVPVQCEYLSMRGLVQLQNTLRMIQENLNPDVKIEGILPTMLDSRTVHAKEAIEILEENFGDLVFRSRIRKAIKFAEAPVKGSSVLKYDSGSNAANYYRELAKEVLANGSS
ncbi:MAG TPA: AAA family ATPase [Solirubrobacterales bacterium]|nr:AAA family ATPase [Solirubrobacterales bacterium]